MKNMDWDFFSRTVSRPAFDKNNTQAIFILHHPAYNDMYQAKLLVSDDDIREVKVKRKRVFIGSNFENITSIKY